MLRKEFGWGGFHVFWEYLAGCLFYEVLKGLFISTGHYQANEFPNDTLPFPTPTQHDPIFYLLHQVYCALKRVDLIFSLGRTQTSQQGGCWTAVINM